MKYLKKFETENDRNTYENSESYIEPYVSYVNGVGVHYNKPPETRVVAKFITTSASENIKILSSTTNTASVEIDGVEQQSIPNNYVFETVGEHTVKYTLIDDTSIGATSFRGCENMVSITIPNSITSIGSSAFYGCSGLTSFTIPSNVTIIGSWAFARCYGLTNMVIPNNVTVIDEDAFYTCSGLTNITISNSVTRINSKAFFACFNLDTPVIIPSGVTFLGTQAFVDCNKIPSVTCLASTPPTLDVMFGGNAAFSGEYPIYVPSELVDTYKTANVWSTYASRIQAIPTT